ncbi:lysine transporter LysE [Pararhizobium antarcticum]|uniref:Lysine transporter LysE n=2 Tax=Pararhizobium antarcticum TaxID=1798805 RepID=A0A657LVN1_9HYPH|nr:LysE family translocator [Pararhizobium antarcticum]OJF95907.1 lysine transporter LysE [Pararhizobium antarcticum]OJF99352.1 lysine transporter LysE [Rhizobium sp. 58]
MTDVSAFLSSTVLPFSIAAVLIEITPGPNMTWLAVVSAVEGRRRGFVAVAGVALGLALIGIAGALGAAALIDGSRVLYEALRWAGVLFLFYLAIEGWLAASRPETAAAGTASGYFLRGLLTNVLNPKALLFYVAVLPGFVAPGPDVVVQTLALTAVYVLIATVIHGLIVLLAGSLAPVLNDPLRERRVRRVLSVLLAGVALWFALTTAR